MVVFERLEREYAKAFLEYELAIAEGRRTRQHDSDKLKKISKYFISTSNRRLFGLSCVRATFDSNPALVSDLAHQIKCSRNAMDKMVSECEQSEWIIIDRSPSNHRYISAGSSMMDAWQSYVKFIRPLSQATKMGQVNTVIKNLHALALIEP